MSRVYSSKFNPGIFPCTQVSWRYSGIKRVREQIKAFNVLRSKDKDNLITGFWVLISWKDLDDNPDYLKALLDDCEANGQYLIVNIWDRLFGSDKKNKDAPIPKAALKLGQRYASNTRNGLVWDSRYVDLQIGLMKKLAKFDAHPALEQVHWGETSIKHDGSAEDYTTQLIRMWHGCKKYFPRTVVPININFLGSDNSHIRRIRDVMQEYGGGGLCNPDVVGGHKKGYTGKYPLYRYDNGKRVPYYIDVYDILIKTESMVIAPHIETWAMRKSQVEESIDIALSSFGATHVKPQTYFSSKYEDDLSVDEYFEEYLYPVLKRITESQRKRMIKRPSRLDYRPNGYSQPKSNAPTNEPNNQKIESKNEPLIMPDQYSLRPKNFSLPSLFQKFEKNEFDFPVIQATRAKTVQGEKFPPSKFEYIRAAKYATTQSFFGKYLMTYEGAAGVSFLLNKSDGSFVKVMRHGLYDAHWLPGTEENPYLAGVHRKSGKLKKFAVETSELVDLDFKVDGITSRHTAGNSEGTMSRSGKILYTNQRGGMLHCVLVDYANKTSRRLKLNTQGGTINTASVSDCGKWIIGMYNNGAGGGIYKYKVASGTLKPVKKYSNRSHHAVLTVHKGKSVYVIMSEIVDGARMVVAYYLDDDRRVVIQGGPGQFTNGSRSKGKALTGHVGLGPITDDDTYVTVSYMDPEGPHTAGLVSLSTGKLYPVAYTHHAPAYLAQAHSVTAYEGDRMVMAAFDNGVRICLIVDITSLGLSDVGDISVGDISVVDMPVAVDPESPVSPLPDVTEPQAEREGDPVVVDEAKKGRIKKIMAAMKLFLENYLK